VHPFAEHEGFAKILEQLCVMTLVKSVDFSKRAACMSQMLRVLATSVGQSSVRQPTKPKPPWAFESKKFGSRGCVAAITSQPSLCKPHKRENHHPIQNLDYLQLHILEVNRYHRQRRCELSTELSNQNCLSVRPPGIVGPSLVQIVNLS
jgi:hypothetical protein